MEKIDFKKEYKNLYKAPTKQPAIIKVPSLNYLMIDGQGSPGDSPAYQQALQALYPVAYTLKFHSKQQLNRDYTVMPLQGLWWADDMDDFVNAKRDQWRWTLMIMQPDWINRDTFQNALEKVRAKKKPTNLDKVRLEKLTEGQCAQILHIGPYADEHPTIMALHQFVQSNDGKLSQKHHEIYLSDPRKTAPEKLKTILRQPFVQH